MYRISTSQALALLLGILALPAMSAAQDAEPAPLLKVEQSHVDLGIVREGGVYEFRYLLKNEGTAPLIIERVQSTCGCTVAKVDDRNIAPGASVTLHASFDSKRRVGKISKYITVKTNDPQTPITQLSFQAVVEALYQVKPPSGISIVNKRRGDPIRNPVRILAGKPGADVEILEVQFDQPALTYTIEAIIENGFKGKAIKFALDKNAPVGMLSVATTIKIQTLGEQATIEFPIMGLVVSDITVRPSRIFEVATNLPGETLRRAQILLRATDATKPFKIVHIDAGENLTFKIREVQPGLEYQLDFSVAPTAKPGPAADTVVIFTDSAEQPIIMLPAHFTVGSKVAVQPRAAFLRRRPGDSSRATQTLNLYCVSQPGFAIEGVSIDNPNFTAKLVAKTAERKDLQSVVVALAEQAPPGQYGAAMTVHTNIEGAKEISIIVFGEVLETPSMTP